MSYTHAAGKISVQLNYFSLRALNQWVVLKQRIQLLKTAWESAWERLLIIDSFYKKVSRKRKGISVLAEYFLCDLVFLSPLVPRTVLISSECSDFLSQILSAC